MWVRIFFLIIVLLAGVKGDENEISFLLKKINITGDHPKLEGINSVVKEYEDKNTTIQDLIKLLKSVSNYYKTEGYPLNQVFFPIQDINNGKLNLQVDVAHIDKIKVTDANYYSDKFIKDGFGLKHKEYLNYREMVHYLLLLNEYKGLKVSSLLKKGSFENSTDVILKVEDEKPFDISIWYDNLGSESTSKNRIGINLQYGNFLMYGDTIELMPIVSFNPSKTKYFSSLYTAPINHKHTKLKLGFVYADYLAANDLSVLDARGDTKIYSVALWHPLKRSFTDKIDIYGEYNKKSVEDFVLGSLTLKEHLDAIKFGFSWLHYDIGLTRQFNLSVYGGMLGDRDLPGRANEDDKFTKLNMDFILSKSINSKLNLAFVSSIQYSNDRLPAIEMFSIGGLTTVRGFKSGLKVGDSGFFTSVEGMYNLGKWNNFGMQIGLFADYGAVYSNKRVKGEKRRAYLLGSGIETLLHYKDKFNLRLSLGYPLDSEDNDYDKNLKLYLTLSAKY